jgi:hypothetical protein
MVENGGGACKNPWRQARGKRFTAWFCWLLWGELYPVGRRSPRRGQIMEVDSGGRAALNPGKSRRCCRIGTGLESEGRHLVLLVADAQHEVMLGAGNDGVGAFI